VISGGGSVTYGTADTLIGRDGDLRRIRDLLGIKVGGGSLLLAGDAGVGKTAVLEALAGAADEEGIRVLRAAGVEFEADCSYSCLNQAHLTLRRGDAAGGMRTLIRSASLTPQGQNRSRRLAEAAYLGAEATGALLSARKLLDDARHAAPDPENSLHSATATALLVLNSDGDVDTAHRLLVGAIESTADTHGYDAGDKALVDALHMLALICFFGVRAELWQPYYRALERLRPKPPLFLSALGRTFSDPARTGAATCGELDLLIASLPGETDPLQINRTGTAALYLDRLGEVREAAWRVVRMGRDGGPARRHLSALIHLCLDDYLTGRWDEALDLADEGLQICEEHGYSAFAWYYLYIKSIISGARGNADDSLATADRIIDWASARGAHCADTLRTMRPRWHPWDAVTSRGPTSTRPPSARREASRRTPRTPCGWRWTWWRPVFGSTGTRRPLITYVRCGRHARPPSPPGTPC